MGAPKKMDNNLPEIGKTEEEKCQLKLQAHVESPVNRVWSARGWWFWVEPNYQGGHKTSNSVRIRNRPSKFRVVLDSEFQIQVLEAFPFDETLFQRFTKLLTNNNWFSTDTSNIRHCSARVKAATKINPNSLTVSFNSNHNSSNYRREA